METQQKFSNDAIASIAKFQSLICWLIVVTLLAYIFLPILTIVTTLVSVYLVYSLAKSLGEVRPWVYIIAMFLPLVSLISLVILIQKSTKVLKANNIRVGVMGANKDDLDKFLTGGTSNRF
jgi:predicted neutral ceramidase superfamily lipid hydrolase